MARKRRYNFRAEFKRLLAPRLLKALQDDLAGRIPLKALQRRAATEQLRIVMTMKQIQQALASARAARARRRSKKARPLRVRILR
jgi:hypothetical protein